MSGSAGHLCSSLSACSRPQGIKTEGCFLARLGAPEPLQIDVTAFMCGILPAASHSGGLGGEEVGVGGER